MHFSILGLWLLSEFQEVREWNSCPGSRGRREAGSRASCEAAPAAGRALHSPAQCVGGRCWAKEEWWREKMSFWSLLVSHQSWWVRPFSAGPSCVFSPCPGSLHSLGKGKVGLGPDHCSLSMKCNNPHFYVFSKESRFSV